MRFSLINGEVRNFQFSFSPKRLFDRFKYLRQGSAPTDSEMVSKLQWLAFICIKNGNDVTEISNMP